MNPADDWRPIPSAHGYQANGLGQIRGPKGAIIRGYVKRGYTYIHVWSRGKKRCSSAHRLVCEAFHGSPLPGYQAAHNDGSRHNNAPSNLRWATRHENGFDSWCHGTWPIGSRNSGALLTEQQVAEIKLICLERSTTRVPAGTYPELAKRFGVSAHTIRDAVRGRNWRHVASPVGAGAES